MKRKSNEHNGLMTPTSCRNWSRHSHSPWFLSFHSCLRIWNPQDPVQLSKQAIWFRSRPHLASQRMFICTCSHSHQYCQPLPHFQPVSSHSQWVRQGLLLTAQSDEQNSTMTDTFLLHSASTVIYNYIAIFYGSLFSTMGLCFQIHTSVLCDSYNRTLCCQPMTTPTYMTLSTFCSRLMTQVVTWRPLPLVSFC